MAEGSRARTAVLDDIDVVAHHWADLVESLIPGTARPGQSPQVTTEQREQLEREARLEWLSNGPRWPDARRCADNADDVHRLLHLLRQTAPHLPADGTVSV